MIFFRQFRKFIYGKYLFIFPLCEKKSLKTTQSPIVIRNGGHSRTVGPHQPHA